MSTSSKAAVAVHLVVQRYRSCKLLLNEIEWVRQGYSCGSDLDDDSVRRNSNTNNQQQQHCGLLLYISFAGGADKAAVEAASEIVLNLPVLTQGLWGDGVSEPCSIKQLLRQQQQPPPQPQQQSRQQNNGVSCDTRTGSTSITIVPQANLTSKVRIKLKRILLPERDQRASNFNLQCAAVFVVVAFSAQARTTGSSHGCPLLFRTNTLFLSFGRSFFLVQQTGQESRNLDSIPRSSQKGQGCGTLRLLCRLRLCGRL